MRKAYLCWFGLVLSSRLFFVARQRPDILRHCSYVFLGAVLDSVRIVFLFLELFWLFYGNECTDHKVSATLGTRLFGLAVSVTGHFGRDILVHKEVMKFVDPVQVTSSQFGQKVLLLKLKLS